VVSSFGIVVARRSPQTPATGHYYVVRAATAVTTSGSTSTSMESVSQPQEEDTNKSSSSSRTVVVHQYSPLFASFQENKLELSSDEEDRSGIVVCCTAMVILNAPIPTPVSPLFQRLWKASTFHVCADGGANRLKQATTTVVTAHSEDDDNNNSYFIPDLITGDLDSLLPDTRTYYQQRGVEIVRVPDQDRNDLDKAVTAVLRHFDTNAGGSDDDDDDGQPPQQQHQIRIRCVVYGAFGGRFDQEMASFQALYKYQNMTNNTTTASLQLVFYDDHTMAFLLPPDCCNHVHLALQSTTTTTTKDDDSNNNNNTNRCCLPSEGPVCGLIPLGGAVDSVTTTGLQWNLQNQGTSFGGLVSTSNCAVNRVVTVTSSQPLVFTAQVHAGIETAWSE
jgi:thiamine pyrophosphokinase